MREASLPLLAAVLSLALAAPAAADRSVTVSDFQFQPATVQILPGESVSWSFQGPTEHTTTSSAGQAERWNSDLKGPGGSLSKTFDLPGRFQYFCQPHPDMRGTVIVGEDEFPRSYSNFKQRRRARRITFAFSLLEPAKVTVRLRGPSRRRVTRRRLLPGRHAIALRRLRKGSYRGTVAFVDDFDEKGIVRTFTVLR